MLAYRDFPPPKVGWFSGVNPFDESLKAANAWVVDQGIEVINVETVITSMTNSPPMGLNNSVAATLLRVWYRPAATASGG